MDETLGTRIKAARKALGLSQDKLAKVLEVATMTVSRWETGALAPERENVRRLAEALGKEPSWLEFGDARAASEDADAPHPAVEAYLDEHPDTDPGVAAELRVFFKRSAMPGIVRELIPATVKELRLQRLQAQADAPKPVGNRRTMAERDAEIRARKKGS
jgi:transcriptional regulator with XRE-family HTH domain